MAKKLSISDTAVKGIDIFVLLATTGLALVETFQHRASGATLGWVAAFCAGLCVWGEFYLWGAPKGNVRKRQ